MVNPSCLYFLCWYYHDIMYVHAWSGVSHDELGPEFGLLRRIDSRPGPARNFNSRWKPINFHNIIYESARSDLPRDEFGLFQCLEARPATLSRDGSPSTFIISCMRVHEVICHVMNSGRISGFYGVFRPSPGLWFAMEAHSPSLDAVSENEPEIMYNILMSYFFNHKIKGSNHCFIPLDRGGVVWEEG